MGTVLVDLVPLSKLMGESMTALRTPSAVVEIVCEP